MQSFVARRLDAVLTSSEVSKRQIVQDFAVSPDRLINVRNGLDTELFRPDPGVAKRPGEILCVGRSSDPNKGIRTLVRALAKLPSEIRLTLVDDDNSDNKVRRWAGELGVLDRLTLTGRVDSAELLALYRRAELVVVPSRYEGFGLPAVEAMSCGTPVVATRAGALTEVMERTGGGLLAPRDDPDALAAAIATLMADPERRAALARTGRERVVEAYSWPQIARTTADAYREVIARRRSAALVGRQARR